MSPQIRSSDENRSHVAVIGAGIVGLAVAYHLAQRGARVTVVDRDPQGDKTSFGNAGGIAVTEVMPAAAPGALFRVFGWMLDPLGPLAVRPTHAPKLIPFLTHFAKASTAAEVDRISRALAAINSRIYDDLVPMLTEVGLADDLQRKGALSVYETEDGYLQDTLEWACKRARGMVCEDVTAAEARRMEPALGPRVHRAVWTPQWSYVSSPRRIVNELREWLVRAGVTLTQGEVSTIHPEKTAAQVTLADGTRLAADKIVVAAGAWSGRLAGALGDRVLLESERGYNMTLPNSGVCVERLLIFAERKFVATPLQEGLRIGGAAEFGGLRAKANYKRSGILVELARTYLPGLQTDGGTSWAGHRPTTPDSLPVIGRSPRHPNLFYAFGHGHLGLTQSATTGKLMSELVLDGRPSIDLAPYSIERFTPKAGRQ